MKQHITVKQWHELSVKAKGIWNKGREPITFGFTDRTGKKTTARNLPNIGQMIEFLMEKGTAFYGCNKKEVDFLVQFNKEIEPKNNLVDAFWEACKEILEK